MDRNISHPKKTFNGGNAAAAAKSMYDDVFGGGAPRLSPRAEDYAEIFGGFNASRASSIPVLDLPLVDETEVLFDVRSSGFDYGEVFGGFDGPDFAVSYEELVKMMRRRRTTRRTRQPNGRGDSSDEAWSPDDVEYLFGESDDSVKSQRLSNGVSYEPIDSSTEFNISYHKANQRNSGEILNRITHVTRIPDVPGYAFVVDKTTSLPKTDDEFLPQQVVDDGQLSMDYSGETMRGRHLRKTVSQPANRSCDGLLLGDDFGSHRRYTRNGSLPNETFVTISDVSLRTKPSQVPPPSRPPPALDVQTRDYDKETPNGLIVARDGTSGDGTPPYFDVEIDASSSAAVSAAAMKDAMERAQAKLRCAKQIMERKRDGFQSRAKSGSKNDRKDKEGKLATVDGSSTRKDESGTGFSVLEEGRRFTKTALPIPGSFEGEQHLNVSQKSAEEKHGRESSSSQGSDIIDGVDEWKEATQFFELVTTNKSTKGFDEVNNSYTVGQNAKSYEHEKAKKAAEAVLEQHQEKHRRAITLQHHELDQYQRKIEIAEEDSIWQQNNGRSETAKVSHGQKGLEKKVEAAHEEENERRMKEILEKKEMERRHREAIEQEENEKRQREASEREEIERRRRESREREENEMRLRECLKKEENEKRMKEILEKKEKERRLREAIEWEENEKRQREAPEREENEWRLREACEREENQKRLGALEKEEKRKEHKGGAGEEIEKICHDGFAGENEKKIEHAGQTEQAHNQEKCMGTLREAQEGEQNETGLKESYETEDIRGASQGSCRWEETETKPKHAGESEELEGVNRNEMYDTLLNQAYKPEDGKNLGATQLKSKKLEANEEIACEYIGKTPTVQKNNVKDAANEAVNILVDEKVEVLGRVQGNMVHEKSQSISKDATESPFSDQSAKKAVEAGHDIGENNSENIKPPSQVVENQGKETAYETRETGKNSKHAKGALDCEGRNDSFMPARVEKESVDSGRKMEAAHPGMKRNTQRTAQQVNGSQSSGRVVLNETEEKETERMRKERQLEMERLKKIDEEREREREREKDRMAVDRATLEARERAYAEVRERAERAATERTTAEARHRVMTEARERLEKACAEAREKSLNDKTSMEARLRAERTAVERATTEARERAFEKVMAERAACEARERVDRTVSDKFYASSRNNGMRSSSSSSSQNAGSCGSSRYNGSYHTERFEVVEGESAQRCKARLERHRRTTERVAKALAEKNMRDLVAQREQAERNRLAETLDADVKRWSSGKEGNLRALLSTLQYILGPDSGWQPIPLTEVITSSAVKKAYRKATLCVHPDKLQQRGASIQQKYICEKVFDLLKEAWNKFNSEER